MIMKIIRKEAAGGEIEKRIKEWKEKEDNIQETQKVQGKD